MVEEQLSIFYGVYMEEIYNTKIIKSGNKIEIYKYKAYIRKGGESKNKEGRRGRKEVSPEEKEANRLKSRFNNLNNAKNKIVRIVASNPDLISFITLTYRENMQDLKKSKQQLNKFFKKLKTDFEELKYLYVLEFQDRGAIHYHILTNFPTNYKKSEYHKFNENFSKKYWRYGFVDCRNLKTEGNTNVAKYISAYLTLDLYQLDLQGMRCYSVSRNCERPTVITLETKCPITTLGEIEGYKLQFYSSYEINYHTKDGNDRGNFVNYFDFISNTNTEDE